MDTKCGIGWGLEVSPDIHFRGGRNTWRMGLDVRTLLGNEDRYGCTDRITDYRTVYIYTSLEELGKGRYLFYLISKST